MLNGGASQQYFGVYNGELLVLAYTAFGYIFSGLNRNNLPAENGSNTAVLEIQRKRERF